jgi:hypothetical protein
LAALEGKKTQVEAIVFDLPQICGSRASVAHEQGAQIPSVCRRRPPEVLRLRHATACNVRYGTSSERAGQRLATIRQINRYARDIAFHGLAGRRRIGCKRQRETVALDGASAGAAATQIVPADALMLMRIEMIARTRLQAINQ